MQYQFIKAQCLIWFNEDHIFNTVFNIFVKQTSHFSFLENFLYNLIIFLSKSCKLIIEESAFEPVYSTLKILEIRETQLGSDELIRNLVRNFKNLTTLVLQSNRIDYIDPTMIPNSVQTMKISYNSFICNCETIRGLSYSTWQEWGSTTPWT